MAYHPIPKVYRVKPGKPFPQNYLRFLALATALVFTIFMYQSSDNEGLIGASSNHTCNGRRIFVYDIPADFNDRIGEECGNWSYSGCPISCDNVVNDGLGSLMNLDATSEPAAELLQPASAWYKTDQFSLEVIFHRRILTHPCRTKNPARASMFYIPFYHALDISRNLFNPDLQHRDALTNSFLAWLREQRPFQLHRGHRHVLPLGRIIWDFHRGPSSNWGSPLLTLPDLAKVTKLLIERCVRSMGLCRTSMAVPYPTNFHPASEAELQSWQARVRSAQRTQFVSLAGAAREDASVRGEVFRQCAGSPKCVHVVCTRKLCVENPQTMYKLALDSVFCLQPAGDSPTRKGIFDSLISGCIPVLFFPNQTVLQYLWHLPGDGSQYSVQIDGVAVATDQYDVIAHLERIPQWKIEQLRESIVQILPSLIFRNPTLAGTYSSKDAFDVSIDSLFDQFDRLDRKKSMFGSLFSRNPKP